MRRYKQSFYYNTGRYSGCLTSNDFKSLKYGPLCPSFINFRTSHPLLRQRHYYEFTFLFRRACGKNQQFTKFRSAIGAESCFEETSNGAKLLHSDIEAVERFRVEGGSRVLRVVGADVCGRAWTLCEGDDGKKKFKN